MSDVDWEKPGSDNYEQERTNQQPHEDVDIEGEQELLEVENQCDPELVDLVLQDGQVMDSYEGMTNYEANSEHLDV